MKEEEFFTSMANTSMYIKKNLNKIVIFIIYIDNMLIMGNSLEGIIIVKK